MGNWTPIFSDIIRGDKQDAKETTIYQFLIMLKENGVSKLTMVGDSSIVIWSFFQHFFSQS